MIWWLCFINSKRLYVIAAWSCVLVTRAEGAHWGHATRKSVFQQCIAFQHLDTRVRREKLLARGDVVAWRMVSNSTVFNYSISCDLSGPVVRTELLFRKLNWARLRTLVSMHSSLWLFVSPRWHSDRCFTSYITGPVETTAWRQSTASWHSSRCPPGMPTFSHIIVRSFALAFVTWGISTAH